MKKLLILAAFAHVGFLHAQDRVFTYAYQSTVLNKSQKDLEVWTTLHNGRTDYYRGIEHRLEFEVGLGSKLQTSFYLNYAYAKGIVTNNGVQSLNNETDFSFSNEWKYKLSDPMANRVGSALYFEYTLSPASTELEGKLIFDKQTGRFIQALNLVGEFDFDKEFQTNDNRLEKKTNVEKKLELNYALAYKINEGFSLGLELFNQNQLSTTSAWENSVLYSGLCFSFSQSGFSLNCSVMPQIANLKGNGLELTEHEQLQARLIFSYEF